MDFTFNFQDNGVVQKKAQLPDRITGLPNFHVECYENVPLDKSDAIEIEGGQQIRFKLFLSGSVVVLKWAFSINFLFNLY
jgi:hypothetical protein